MISSYILILINHSIKSNCLIFRVPKTWSAQGGAGKTMTIRNDPELYDQVVFCFIVWDYVQFIIGHHPNKKMSMRVFEGKISIVFFFLEKYNFSMIRSYQAIIRRKFYLRLKRTKISEFKLTCWSFITWIMDLVYCKLSLRWNLFRNSILTPRQIYFIVELCLHRHFPKLQLIYMCSNLFIIGYLDILLIIFDYEFIKMRYLEFESNWLLFTNQIQRLMGSTL